MAAAPESEEDSSMEDEHDDDGVGDIRDAFFCGPPRTCTSTRFVACFCQKSLDTVGFRLSISSPNPEMACVSGFIGIF